MLAQTSLRKGQRKQEKKSCYVLNLWFFMSVLGTAACQGLSPLLLQTPALILSPWGHTMLGGLYPAADVHLEHPGQEKRSLKGGKCWLGEQADFEPVATDPECLPSLGTPWFVLRKEKKRKDPISNVFDWESFFSSCIKKKRQDRKKGHILFQTQNLSCSFRMGKNQKFQNHQLIVERKQRQITLL